jgi:hypothetical protein
MYCAVNILFATAMYKTVLKTGYNVHILMIVVQYCLSSPQRPQPGSGATLPPIYFNTVFSSPQGPARLWGHPASYPNSVPGALSQRIKWQGCEADTSPPSRSEVKNIRAIPPLPICLHGIVVNYIIT